LYQIGDSIGPTFIKPKSLGCLEAFGGSTSSKPADNAMRILVQSYIVLKGTISL
jgi:hypothetical protein